jgi:hypothetical protein
MQLDIKFIEWKSQRLCSRRINVRDGKHGLTRFRNRAIGLAIAIPTLNVQLQELAIRNQHSGQLLRGFLLQRVSSLIWSRKERRISEASERGSKPMRVACVVCLPASRMGGVCFSHGKWLISMHS